MRRSGSKCSSQHSIRTQSEEALRDSLQKQLESVKPNGHRDDRQVAIVDLQVKNNVIEEQDCEETFGEETMAKNMSLIKKPSTESTSPTAKQGVLTKEMLLELHQSSKAQQLVKNYEFQNAKEDMASPPKTTDSWEKSNKAAATSFISGLFSGFTPNQQTTSKSFKQQSETQTSNQLEEKNSHNQSETDKVVHGETSHTKVQQEVGVQMEAISEEIRKSLKVENVINMTVERRLRLQDVLAQEEQNKVQWLQILEQQEEQLSERALTILTSKLTQPMIDQAVGSLAYIITNRIGMKPEIPVIHQDSHALEQGKHSQQTIYKRCRKAVNYIRLHKPCELTSTTHYISIESHDLYLQQSPKDQNNTQKDDLQQQEVNEGQALIDQGDPKLEEVTRMIQRNFEAKKGFKSMINKPKPENSKVQNHIVSQQQWALNVQPTKVNQQEKNVIQAPTQVQQKTKQSSLNQPRPKVQPSDPELDKAINTFLENSNGQSAIKLGMGTVSDEYTDDLNQRQGDDYFDIQAKDNLTNQAIDKVLSMILQENYKLSAIQVEKQTEDKLTQQICTQVETKVTQEIIEDQVFLVKEEMYDRFLDKVTSRVSDRILNEVILLIELSTMDQIASTLSDKVEEQMIKRIIDFLDKEEEQVQVKKFKKKKAKQIDTGVILEQTQFKSKKRSVRRRARSPQHKSQKSKLPNDELIDVDFFEKCFFGKKLQVKDQLVFRIYAQDLLYLIKNSMAKPARPKFKQVSRGYKINNQQIKEYFETQIVSEVSSPLNSNVNKQEIIVKSNQGNNRNAVNNQFNSLPERRQSSPLNIKLVQEEEKVVPIKDDEENVTKGQSMMQSLKMKKAYSPMRHSEEPPSNLLQNPKQARNSFTFVVPEDGYSRDDKSQGFTNFVININDNDNIAEEFSSSTLNPQAQVQQSLSQRSQSQRDASIQDSNDSQNQQLNTSNSNSNKHKRSKQPSQKQVKDQSPKRDLSISIPEIVSVQPLAKQQRSPSVQQQVKIYQNLEHQVKDILKTRDYSNKPFRIRRKHKHQSERVSPVHSRIVNQDYQQVSSQLQNFLVANSTNEVVDLSKVLPLNFEMSNPQLQINQNIQILQNNQPFSQIIPNYSQLRVLRNERPGTQTLKKRFKLNHSTLYQPDSYVQETQMLQQQARLASQFVQTRDQPSRLKQRYQTPTNQSIRPSSTQYQTISTTDNTRGSQSRGGSRLRKRIQNAMNTTLNYDQSDFQAYTNSSHQPLFYKMNQSHLKSAKIKKIIRNQTAVHSPNSSMMQTRL